MSNNNFDPNEMVIVLSYGQSLSVGHGTHNPIISSSNPYEGTSFRLKNGQLQSLVAERVETHDVAMVNRIAYDFEANNLISPKLLSLSAGVSGATIQELYIDQSNHASNIEEGLSTTGNSDLFYVTNSQGKPDIYMNNDGAAQLLDKRAASTAYNGVYFEGVLNNLSQAKVAADAAGIDINNKLYFTFIQGQSNDKKLVGSIEYEDMLQKLVSKIDEAADTIFNKDMEIVTVITQTRGYASKEISLEQLDFVNHTSNSYLGALEFQYQAENPYAYDYLTGNTRGTDLTHLNSVGYNMMGQDLGDTIFGAMTGTQDEDDVISIDNIVLNGKEIVVTFTGLKGHLVEDPSIFSSLVNGPPAHFGFYIYHSKGEVYVPGLSLPHIIASAITGNNEVRLTLDKEISALQMLSLGGTKYKENGTFMDYGGTTLRDSVTSEANNFYNVDALEDASVKSFVPTQNVWINKTGLVETPFPNETFIGTNDHDVFDGKAGFDTVDYSSSGAISVDLLHNKIHGSYAESDTLISIENIIGSNNADKSQRDWIWGNDYNNKIYGMAGDDILEGGYGADVIDGGDGWDYARYTRSESAVFINLATNVNTGGDAQGDTLINIEAVVGSRFNDVIIGSDNNDFLSGEDGNDRLDGGAGFDKLYGKNGADTYVYSSGRDEIYEQGTDVDIVEFSSVWRPDHIKIHGDIIILSDGNNQIKFNDISLIEYFKFSGYTHMTLSQLEQYSLNNNNTGDDADNIFYAYSTAEHFDGGLGNDTIDYSASTGGINVDLETGYGAQYGATSDTYLSIENITGSNISSVNPANPNQSRDWIWGNADSNIIRGLAGNDILEGGAGADVIDGGAGWDYARYTRSNEAVHINLKTNIHTGGHAEGDSLYNIEAVTGSDYDDVLIGGDSNDFLSGGRGNDTLYGNMGYDQLIGNEGQDRFVFMNESAYSHSDDIRDFSISDHDIIDISDLLSDYDPLTESIEDFVHITNDGSHSYLNVDQNGGGDSFVQIAKISNVSNIDDVQQLVNSGLLFVV